MISDAKQSYVFDNSSDIDFLHIFHDMIIDLFSSVSMNSRRKNKQSEIQKQIFAKANERSLNKKKKQARKFYDVFEVFRLSDKSTKRQTMKHLFKKFDFID